jgi:archaellum biogenesis ATPase FlaH
VLMNDKKQPFNLEQFSLRGRSADMKKTLSNQHFVWVDIAIAGQSTAIYAQPNSGKTLLSVHLVCEAVRKKLIEGEQVFYINADDTAKGLTEKTEILERFDIHQISPHDPTRKTEFKANDFGLYLQQLCAEGSAKGKIIILDTLKKFTKLMEKQQVSEFNTVIRQFISHGGTLIALAHVNKYKDEEGNSIAEGTSDVINDWDCVYILEQVTDNGCLKTVEFRNQKNRGNNAKSVSFSYSIDDDYQAMLRSVKRLTNEDHSQAKMTGALQKSLSKNNDIIVAIQQNIMSQTTNRTELVTASYLEVKDLGYSKSQVRNTLDDHEGRNYELGHRWKSKKGDKNAQIYTLLHPPTPLEN